MIKKLFYLISVVMIVYTGMMIRMRPGQMFKAKSKAKNAVVRDSSEAAASKKVFKKSFEIDEERKVILRNFTGTISIERKGELLDVEKGMSIGFKDSIRTGKSSVAILGFANNSIIKIFSNSRFNITKIQSRERSSSNLQYNLFDLRKGALLVDFINQGKSHFLEVTTPASKIQIRGTQFLYLHNEKKNRSQLAVREGIVKVYGAESGKSKFVVENQGLLISGRKALGDPIEDKWVEKINWSKLARGSGIDLYDPRASNQVKDAWKKRREELQRRSFSQVSQNIGNAAGKTKTGGILKSVVGKVLEVGGAIAKKGAATMKSANPVSKISEVGQDVKNFEDEQKKKQQLIDSLDED